MGTEVKKEVKPIETPITETSVLEKAQKGEELNDKEKEFLKSSESDGAPAPADDKETGKAASEPKAEDKKPAETSEPAAKKEEVTEDRKGLILAEVNKPENLVDLSKLKMTPTELGLYWDLRKARRKNQKIEEELEVERVGRIVTDLKNNDVKTEKKSEVDDDPLKALEGRDPDDILTVADVIKILSPKKKEAAKPIVGKTQGILSVEQIRFEKVEADQKLRANGIEDFREVVDFAEEALKNDPDAIDILRETARTGGNTSEKTYWLIKASAKWPDIEKEIKADREKRSPKPVEAKTPPKENVDRGKKIEENEGKMKTTGPGTGAVADTGEYTNEEIANMTINDIKKLPRTTRQAILKKYGSEPNYSV